MLKRTFAAAVLTTALAAAFVAQAHDGCDAPPAGRPVIHTTELLFDLKSDKLTLEALERLEDLGRKLAITDVETVIAIAHAPRLRPVVRDFLAANGVGEDRFYFETDKQAGPRLKLQVIGRTKGGD
jgi:hypothetical protein